MGWGVELDWHELWKGGCVLGIVDDVRVAHVGEPGSDYDAGLEATRIHEELARRRYEGWKDVQRTVGVWRPWTRTPPWLGSGWAVTEPSLSVVVSTYEWPDALDAVLRGFADQTDEDFELVVADDGSGAATAEVVDTLEDLVRGPALTCVAGGCGLSARSRAQPGRPGGPW